MATEFLTMRDANWDLQRGVFNLLIDQQPAGIALPRSPDDVSDVVRSAAADGKHVAAHCTGHLEPEGAGALASLPGSFLAFGAVFVPVPEMMAPTRGWLDVLKASLSPYDAGIYLNFAEQRFEITKAFPPETVDRLREVKRRYDPEDVFKSNHPVTG
jgi:FAD/FMN-containing dehydrogenase